MAIRPRRKVDSAQGVPIAPMIDVVFLLLIYFMVTSSLQKQEADLSFQLPGVAESLTPLDLPDEQILEITADGRVILNDFVFEGVTSGPLPSLVATLTRYRQTNEANQMESIVTLAPEDGALHEWIVRVMDACISAGLDRVNFALEGLE